MNKKKMDARIQEVSRLRKNLSFYEEENHFIGEIATSFNNGIMGEYEEVVDINASSIVIDPHIYTIGNFETRAFCEVIDEVAWISSFYYRCFPYEDFETETTATREHNNFFVFIHDGVVFCTETREEMYKVIKNLECCKTFYSKKEAIKELKKENKRLRKAERKAFRKLRKADSKKRIKGVHQFQEAIDDYSKLTWTVVEFEDGTEESTNKKVEVVMPQISEEDFDGYSIIKEKVYKEYPRMTEGIVRNEEEMTTKLVRNSDGEVLKKIIGDLRIEKVHHDETYSNTQFVKPEHSMLCTACKD